MNQISSITTKSTVERRAVPSLRANTQEAFEHLITVLIAAGKSQLAEQLKGFSRIEDAMRADPRLIKNLLDLVWAFRSHAELRALLTASDGSLPGDESTPLGPCGETFSGLRQGVLRGTARVFLGAAARAVSEADGARPVTATPETGKTARAAKAKSGKAIKAAATKPQGLLARLKQTLGFETAAAPKAEPRKSTYPLLQQYLVSDHQFALIADYAKLAEWQINALGELIIGFTDSAMVLAASSLEEKHLFPLVSLAKMLASTALEAGPDAAIFTKNLPSALAKNDNGGKSDVVAGHSLGHLLITHTDMARPIAELDQQLAEGVVKRMAKSLGNDAWSALANTNQARNILYCPDFLIQRLGANAVAVNEGFGTALEGVKNRDAALMLINNVLDRIGSPNIGEAMSHKNLVNWRKAFRTINDSPSLPAGADLTQGMAAARMANLIDETYRDVTRG